MVQEPCAAGVFHRCAVTALNAQPHLELLQCRAAFTALARPLRAAEVATVLLGVRVCRFARCVARGPLETGLEAVSAAGSSQKVHHRPVSDVLETTFTTEAPLVPYLAARLHETPFTLQNENGLAACGTVAFGAPICREARTAEKPRAGTNIFDRKPGTD